MVEKLQHIGRELKVWGVSGQDSTTRQEIEAHVINTRRAIIQGIEKDTNCLLQQDDNLMARSRAFLFFKITSTLIKLLLSKCQIGCLCEVLQLLLCYICLFATSCI
jgi:hypothetical protein